MSHSSHSYTLRVSMALLGLTLFPSTSAATEPAAKVCSDDEPAEPTFWPLYDRDAVDVEEFEIPFEDKKTGIRNYIWNSFGEFQESSGGHAPNDYVHTGIDLNAYYSAAGGDAVIVAQTGYIWGAHNYKNDKCEDAYNCEALPSL